MGGLFDPCCCCSKEPEVETHVEVDVDADAVADPLTDTVSELKADATAADPEVFVF